MPSSDSPRVLAIFGPTAAGKSALAHAAAVALGGEIVVADPFQRYRGLEVAADSPGEAEKAEVPYHLVGDLALTDESSAGDYATLAHAAIDGIVARGRVPVVTGGTGLYLRAALADLDFPERPNPETRDSVEMLVARDPARALDELRERAPEVAERIDTANPRRVSRALMLARDGRTAPQATELWSDGTRHPTLVVGVSRPRPVLDALIARRVERERTDGLIEELERAVDTPGFSRTAAQIIGVKEVLALREGQIEAAQLSELLSARTRRLARAQLTWMNKTPGVHLLDLGEEPAVDALPRLLGLWQTMANGSASERIGYPA